MNKNNVDLKLGNCLDVMKTMANNSVDSIVTDPPYGISFMGKKWDVEVPSVEIWKEAFRVLKPGGYLLSFAGTRTQHRMACNIEDAGFEIRDMIAWVYGCYSEDTECLTDSGWKKYNDIVVGTDKILQWNPTTNKLSWYMPDNVLIYPAPSNMVNIVNRHTDQLLTENHSVYAKIKTHSRNESPTTYTRIDAGKIKNHWQKDFPVAGELDCGYTVENPYMIGWWLTDAWVHKDGKACMFSQSKYKTLELLKNALSLADCEFSEYIKNGKKETHKDEHTFYVTGKLSKYLIDNFPKRKLLMEVLKWDWDSRNLLLNGLLDGDGISPINSHAETFWSLDRERLDVFQALCVSLNIRSHIDYNKGCVYINRKTNTTQIQSKHTINNIAYSGENVWCLTTESGAFVVRRNGRAFISGNSGFPKSQNISKAMDKAAGVEREVIGVNYNYHSEGDRGGSGLSQHGVSDGSFSNPDSASQITAPATEESKQWDGWGSALKPAMEPITMARKPLSESTIVANVLKHSTGGINIDGCRIYTLDSLGGGNNTSLVDRSGKHDGWKRPWMNDETSIAEAAKRSLESTAKSEELGRFPANFIHDGSDEVIGIFPITKSGVPGIKRGGNDGPAYGAESRPSGTQMSGFGDSGSAARFFYCAKTSQKDRNEGLDNFEKVTKNRISSAGGGGGGWSADSASHPNLPAANHHPTVKPTSLMKYLVRLVTPPNGTVLDPFMGSGSTGKAAVLEGFSFVGIEMSEEYLAISKARIEHAMLQSDADTNFIVENAEVPIIKIETETTLEEFWQ